jgi:hypothetical protein
MRYAYGDSGCSAPPPRRPPPSEKGVSATKNMSVNVLKRCAADEIFLSARLTDSVAAGD